MMSGQPVTVLPRCGRSALWQPTDLPVSDTTRCQPVTVTSTRTCEIKLRLKAHCESDFFVRRIEERPERADSRDNCVRLGQKRHPSDNTMARGSEAEGAKRRRITSSSDSSGMDWQQLPDPVVHHIASLAPPEWRCMLAQTSRQLRAAVALLQKPSAPQGVALADLCHSTDLLLLAKRQGLPWDSTVAAEIARGGHLECLEWALLSQQCPKDEDVCAKAALGGHLDVLQWLRAQGCPWDEETCSSAASAGHLDCLKWARAQGCPWGTSTCSEASAAGQLETLKWLRHNGCPWESDTFWKAAKQGNLEVMKWCWDSGFYRMRLGPVTCAAAASSGHLHVLKWAVAHGIPWTLNASRGAAVAGKLEVLRFATEQGFPVMDASVTSSAADGGHLRVLQWLRDNNCPWDSTTTSKAAAKGRMEVLRWARDNGCPWDPETYCSGLAGGNPEVIKYLEDGGCPKPTWL